MKAPPSSPRATTRRSPTKRPTAKRTPSPRAQASAPAEPAAARSAAKLPEAPTPEPASDVKAAQAAPAAAPAKRRGGRPRGSCKTIRPDSLHHALDDDEKRRQVIRWYYAEGLSERACIRQIEAVFGLKTNARALKYFVQLYGFAQKVEEAKVKAEAEKGRLPPDWETKVREALAQRKFVSVFNELSQQQLLAYEKMELEKKKIDLKAAAIFLTDRRQALAEKKAGAGEASAAPPALSAEEETLRIQSILGQA